MSLLEIGTYAMLALLAFSALVTVYLVDRPRQPIPPGVAVAVVVVNTLEMAVLFGWLRS